jgi:hypothetical protein
MSWSAVRRGGEGSAAAAALPRPGEEREREREREREAGGREAGQVRGLGSDGM